MSDLANLEENIPALRRYAWSLLRNAGEADDLVQDCLLRALDRRHTLRSPGDIRPWLFTIMHNLYCSHWRRMRRRAASPSAGSDDAQPPGQPASLEMQDVLRGLAALPEDQRQVLLLVAVEGLGYAETAGILDVPVGTVMSRLSRARDRLRDFVDGQERPKLRRVK